MSARLAALRTADQLAPDSARIGTGSPLGSWAALAGVLDADEVARRTRAGLGTVTSVQALEVLLGLPWGLPVPTGALSVRERQALAAAPAGCVEQVPDGIVRRVRPPLTPVLAVIPATRGWQAGLVAAGRYAPFCARAMVLRRPPRDVATACLEADYWGVGLIIAHLGDPEVLVPPEPYRPHRHTARRWWFAEQVHQALAAQDDAPAAGAA